jgi:hypothetical protein
MLADKLPSREMILAGLEYRATHRIESFYPETGPLRRELYRKHMDFLLNNALLSARFRIADEPPRTLFFASYSPVSES